MEEIEVGEYIRTKEKGVIGKVIKINYGMETDCEEKVLTVYCLDCNRWTIREQIKNHSKEIIDLVEAGDYVNGIEVLDIYKPRDLWEPIELRINDKHINFLIKDDIKSIVTKEMYKNIEYRLE